jgi:hypothetical protein
VADAKCTITKGGPLESSLDWAITYAEKVDPLAKLRADVKHVISEREAREAVAAPSDASGDDDAAARAKEKPSSEPA